MSTKALEDLGLKADDVSLFLTGGSSPPPNRPDPTPSSVLPVEEVDLTSPTTSTPHQVAQVRHFLPFH